jgi:hypothetical protein
MERRQEMGRRGLLVAMGGLLLLCTPSVHAQPAPPSLSVELDIAEQVRGGGRESLTLTLTLAGERGCSSVQLRREAVAHDVKVCREGGDPGAPVLSFDIDRNESSPRGRSHARFHMTSRLALGKRTVVGRWAHADGSGAHVTATVR